MADQEIPIPRLNILPIMFSILDLSQNNQSHQILLLNPLILQLTQDTAGPRPASKASIEALKTISVEENISCEEGIECECMVCLEGLFEKEDGVVKEMPCGHRYHGECIERWLKMQGSCPVCRYCMPEEKEEKRTPAERSEEGRSGVWVSFMFGPINGGDGDASRTD